MFSDYVVYADESGDHGLVNINPQSPVFVLIFCIFPNLQYSDVTVPALKRLKLKYWGHDNIVIHSREIRKRIGDFTILNSDSVRSDFLSETSAVIAGSELTIVAAAIDKLRLTNRYAIPEDPYKIALCFCVERLQMFLRGLNQHRSITHILAERRGKKEDAELNLEFSKIIGGNNRVGAMENLKLLFVDKKCNSSGLQIADLVSYPIAQKVAYPERQNPAYQVVERKIRRRAGRIPTITGYGLKVFP